MPDPDPHRHLHQRLLRGDRDAPERLVAECAPLLQRLLRRRYLALPREAVADAANDALLALIRHPERYEPGRLPLLKYLTLIADRKLIDMIRQKIRDSSRIEFVGGLVELAAAESKEPLDENAPGPGDDPDRLPPELLGWIEATLPDPADRAFVNLMSEGERDAASYARLIGAAELPDKERAAAVKRNRDRILKRLQRRNQANRAPWSDDHA